MLTAVAVCAALYGFVVIGLYAGQRKLLFRCDAGEVDPATLGLKADIVRLKTEDGESLLAWSIPPLAGRPLILYFHGNSGGIDLRIERFHAIAKAGMGLLAIEYRGYASSTGSPSERGLKLDGEAAYAAAVASGVAPERIVPLGESLGSGVAVALAARHTVGALVLDSPYSSIADVAAAAYWFVPARALIRDPFRNDLLIGSVKAPMLIVHGTKDTVVPIRFGEKLFALANPPKEFWRVEDAVHLALGERFADMLDWIGRVVPST
ncbi:MAG: alpha/beta hydrolase [Hyphomicrobiales bacterium]|nr:alpha/beta hydrolase [Hyphomicrobiales bacterium]